MYHPCLSLYAGRHSCGQNGACDGSSVLSDRLLCGTTVLTGKNHQPTFDADLAPSVADSPAGFIQDSTLDLHRERHVVRGIRVSTARNASLKDWPLVEHVAALTPTVTIHATGKTSQDVFSLIAPLTPAKARPQCFLPFVRGQWSSENTSHDVRAVPFGEDRSHVRTGSVPQIVATLRTRAISLMHRSGFSPLAATRRHAASYPRNAFDHLLPRRFS